MDLSPTHLHLLLNHFPTIGFIIGTGLFVAALIARSDHLKQASLVIFVGIALITIPTYVTGNAAQSAIRDSPNVSPVLITAHESAAFIALWLMLLTGGFAWLGLWQYRRLLRLPAWNTAVVMLLAVATLALVSRAANIGGEISHPEIRAVQEALEESPTIVRTVGDYVRDTPGTWIAAETLHFVGLSLLVGVVLLIDLRALGVIRTVPFGAVDRLLPWAVLGFGLNTVTGMLFFVASPDFYTSNPAFYWKLIFILGAGANTLYFFFDKGWAMKPGTDAPAFTKLVALSALVLWVGVMYWGSMLPFIGNAF
jgi:uncharacterized membrane protein